ncbi:hypothetical protein BDP27DRAFT_1418197 [Rhodocollybia butyracea]|uniref:DUF7330 domain-containing protein n=1 Tax=Rhodocollybia butyracea TaxID=206335 RepID=A0A9P5UAQ5_9AGAR|nr:hypothetical protein BDP27DRAFT_1418197 [Rhodocollybia butyracea]
MATDSSITKSDLSMDKSTEAPLSGFPSDLDATTSPPPYSNAASSSPPRSFMLPAKNKPCNFFAFTRTHNPLKATSVLDPSLEIPRAWLPPLLKGETEETRSNFYIKSEYGDVTLELYLLDKPIVGGRKKVLLNASSTYKSTLVHIHRDGLSPPFVLHSHSTTTPPVGNIIVRIPRSFKGTITAGSIHGPVSMSPAISRQAYVFSDLISFEDENFAAKPDKVAAKPNEVAAKPDEVAAKPDEVAAKPNEVAAKPNEVAAKPDEVAAKPNEVAAKPDEVTAKPDKATAKLAAKAAAKLATKPAPKPAPTVKLAPKPAPKLATKPGAKLAPKPACPKPAAKLTAKPAAKLAAKPAAKPAAKLTAKPAAKLTAKPAAKLATKPAAKLQAAKPATKPAAKACRKACHKACCKTCCKSCHKA